MTQLAFTPLPLLSNPHLMTVVAARSPQGQAPASQTELVQLADGDQLALEVSTPVGWQAHQATVVMIHGLGGCHESPYLIRMARKLVARGLRAVRMNMRGCGSGKWLAKRPYHAGRSADVWAVLNYLQQQYPQSPLHLIGVSLGGNVVLKLAAELAEQAPEWLQQVIAVCPPADLAACANLLARPRNRFYDQHFVDLLKRSVAERHQHFGLAPMIWPKQMNLRTFDDIYTAPQGGFRDAADYYACSSSAALVPAINLPCKILFAKDDPFIDGTVFDALHLPDQVDVFHTAYGGHVGFLAQPQSPFGLRWLDGQLLHWLGA
nr:hydrolase, alpha/beta fold family functionally coupled to Phosphoribulokinase [uncultured bacterium]